MSEVHGTRLMAKSSPYLGPKATILNISIAGCEGEVINRGE